MAQAPLKQQLGDGFNLTVYPAYSRSAAYEVVALESERLRIEFHAGRRFTSRETKLGILEHEAEGPCMVLQQRDSAAGQFNEMGVILVQHKELTNVLAHDDVKEPIEGVANIAGFKPGSYLAHMFEPALMSTMRTDMLRMPVPVVRVFMLQIKKTSALFAAKAG